MIPAGPERDKVIAELRGYDIATVYYDSRGRVLPENMADGKSKKQIVSYGWKPGVACRKSFNHSWRPITRVSTDIACAMELWEEMFTPQFHNLCTWDLYINGFCPSKSNPKHYFSANIKNKSTGFKHRTGNVRHDTADKAIADVISGAYEKWREGQ